MLFVEIRSQGLHLQDLQNRFFKLKIDLFRVRLQIFLFDSIDLQIIQLRQQSFIFIGVVGFLTFWLSMMHLLQRLLIDLVQQ